MLWLIFLLSLVMYALVVRRKNRKFHKIHKQLPFPCNLKQVPILGHALLLLGNAHDRMKVLQQIGKETVDKCDGISSLWLANKFLVVIADPEAAEVVMKTCLDKDEILDVTKQLLGNGSFIAPVPIWRPRRKILASIFSQKTLNSFVKTFSTNSSILIEKLKTAAANGNFSIFEKVTKYSMDSVCANILGIKINSHNTSIHPVPLAFNQYCLLTASRIVRPWLYPDTIYKWTWNYPQYKRSVNILKEFVTEIIKSKRNDVSLQKNDSADKEDTKLKSFLKLVIETGGFTDQELQEEALVLLIAGTDTTAVTSSFLSLMLAKYPEIQEKVYQEIKEVVGDSKSTIEASDLPKLRYLDALIRETLRMFPPAPIIIRKVDKKVKLPSGVTLVPGVGVAIHIWAIHRNPKYWGSDANLFRPERFFEGPLKHPSAFLAFSSGPRGCVGAQYAMTAVKTLMVQIIRRYRILPSSSPGSDSTDEEPPTTYEIILKHVNNFEIQLQLRNMEN